MGYRGTAGTYPADSQRTEWGCSSDLLVEQLRSEQSDVVVNVQVLKAACCTVEARENTRAQHERSFHKQRRPKEHGKRQCAPLGVVPQRSAPPPHDRVLAYLDRNTERAAAPAQIMEALVLHDEPEATRQR